MDALDANVREQQVQLHYYKVVAPRAGVVGDIPVRVGDRVTVTTVLTTIDQPGSLEAYVYVPIEHSAKIKMNLPMQVLDGEGKVVAESRISFISPQVDTTTQTVLVKRLNCQRMMPLRCGNCSSFGHAWYGERIATRKCRFSQYRGWRASILRSWRRRRVEDRLWHGKNL